MGYFRVIPATPDVLGLLDPDAAADLRALGQRVMLPRGAVAYRRGEPPEHLYVVEEGKLKLGRAAGDGRGSIVALLGPGDVLGEACVLDGHAHSVTATAVTDCLLLEIDGSAVNSWLAAFPAAVMPLLGVLARRVRAATDSLAERTFSEVAARLARELLGLAQRFGTRTERGIRVEHDLTQDELAQLVGSCRETVNKALSDFAGRGWVQVEARAVVLVNVERLRRRARSVLPLHLPGAGAQPRPTHPAGALTLR
jgi:CRP/FNR family transcriptional regulator, cyclic AMP receptor protein